MGDEGRLLADGMHLPVGSVGCGENYGTVGSHEGAGPCGPSLAPLQGVNSRYHQVDDADAGGGGGEMSESAAVGELWWTERLVGEAQAEHPGELVRTGWFQLLLTVAVKKKKEVLKVIERRTKSNFIHILFNLTLSLSLSFFEVQDFITKNALLHRNSIFRKCDKVVLF